MSDKLNFLLFGKTGQGKSATGNSILIRKSFQAKADQNSVTEKVSNSFSRFDQYTLLVVDGPGLKDTKKTDPEDKKTAAKNMSEALAMCYGGIDAFVYVLKFGNRFTSEDRATLEELKAIFGPKYLEHVIVVMTSGDMFEASMEEEDSNFTFHEWCKTQTGVFGELYTNCKERYVLFNNREKDEKKKRAQVQELVNFTLEIRKYQGRYSSQCFDEAEKEREKMILEACAPELKREIQEKVSILSADLEKLQNRPNASEQDNIRARISDLKCRIAKENKGHGVLNDLQKQLEVVEENLEDVNKLHALAKNLEETRKSKKAWTLLGAVCTVAGGVLCLAAAPVAAAVAVGTGVVVAGGGTAAVVSTTAAGIKRLVLRNKEKEIEKEQIEIRKKIKSANKSDLVDD